MDLLWLTDGHAEGFSRELEEEASKLEIPAMVVDMEDIFSTGDHS